MGFGQIEQALAAMHSVDSSRAAGFRARLRYLQQKVDIGLPRGGSGRRANFTIGHALLFGLALELEQFGLTPERVAAALSGQLQPDNGTLCEAVYEAADRIGSHKPAVLLWFVPESLSDATKVASHRYDLSAATLAWCEAGNLPAALFEPDSPVLRLATINLSAFVRELAEHLGREAGSAEYVSALIAWANNEESE